MFLEDSGGRKSMKNPWKSDLATVWRWGAKATPKNAPKWLQHGSKIDPTWGHLGLQNRLGPAQEQTKNDTENKTEKNNPNINLCEQGTGSAQALWTTPTTTTTSKTHQTSTQNRPKIGPKSVQNRSKIGFGTDLASNIDFGPFWDRFGSHFGAILGASWGSSWDQVDPKIDFWRSWAAFKNEPGFWYLLNSISDPFWSDLGVKNGAKIAPKTVSRAIKQKMQKC